MFEGEETEEVVWSDVATSLTSIGVTIDDIGEIISSFFRPAFLEAVPEESFALTGGV